MDKEYEGLKLKNQLCFPLYAASREVIKQYRPYLDAINLTYTQYIAMMVFWEEKKISVKELGKKLFLDSGTLTPVLKSLEAKGYISRSRSVRSLRIRSLSCSLNSLFPLISIGNRKSSTIFNAASYCDKSNIRDT